jgi:hypothetical protein
MARTALALAAVLLADLCSAFTGTGAFLRISQKNGLHQDAPCSRLVFLGIFEKRTNYHGDWCMSIGRVLPGFAAQQRPIISWIDFLVGKK